MIRNLPEEYLKRMKASLSEDYEAFLSCYERPAEKALRFRPGRIREETREKLIREWKLEAVPWCSDGYYYSEDIVRPGLSPYHDAGLFYIQEPSAMITAASADILPIHLVLDLCAAPGGKSTQAAAAAGLLVSNEPIPARARILSSNIERMGFVNTVVTSAWPDELAGILPEVFDRIIVDAPCSGEGMMRKDETAVEEWSEANVRQCVARQEEILEAASVMLRPGGKIIYSTCTFEYDENEGQIRSFLMRHPEYTLLGQHTLYPHQVRGEGHFCAVLQKEGISCPGIQGFSEIVRKAKGKKGRSLSDGSLKPEDLGAFLKKQKIHVLRVGLEKGETKEDRKGRNYYTPTHAEAMAKSYESDPGAKLNITDPDLCLRYLKGESLQLEDADPAFGAAEEKNVSRGLGYVLSGPEGWLTVYYDGYPLGLGKRTGNTIKNHYPKGLRRLS